MRCIFDCANIKLIFQSKKIQPLKWFWFLRAVRNVTATTSLNTFKMCDLAVFISRARRLLNRNSNLWRNLDFFFWTLHLVCWHFSFVAFSLFLKSSFSLIMANNLVLSGEVTSINKNLKIWNKNQNDCYFLQESTQSKIQQSNSGTQFEHSTYTGNTPCQVSFKLNNFLTRLHRPGF